MEQSKQLANNSKELEASKKTDATQELLVRMKKDGIEFHFETIKTPEDLRSLLEEVMLEGQIEVDCAAMIQIVVFMTSDEAIRPSFFVLGFGTRVWEHATYYQRHRFFTGMSVAGLGALSHMKDCVQDVVRTVDVVALTFGENVRLVTSRSNKILVALASCRARGRLHTLLYRHQQRRTSCKDELGTVVRLFGAWS